MLYNLKYVNVESNNFSLFVHLCGIWAQAESLGEFEKMKVDKPHTFDNSENGLMAVALRKLRESSLKSPSCLRKFVLQS